MSADSKTCPSCKTVQGNAWQSNSQPKSDIHGAPTHVSVFDVPQMDCPSEESLIRTAFTSLDETITFEFDIPNRRVRVYHTDIAETVDKSMMSVGLGAKLISLEPVASDAVRLAQEKAKASEVKEAQVLRWLLIINALMFLLEFGVGIVAQSAGLIADSLDMFADAAVYSIALFAVGKAAKQKLKAAHLSGGLQVVLGLGVLFEVIRRLIYGSEPVSILIMGMGFVALTANVACLLLLFKSRNEGSHMKASWIFSANDVLANLGVIIAGILVAVTGSQAPDMVAGLVIGLIVLNGARRILLLR